LNDKKNAKPETVIGHDLDQTRKSISIFVVQTGFGQDEHILILNDDTKSCGINTDEK